MSDYRDCSECYYGQRLNKGSRMCDVLSVPLPCNYMRQPSQECGVEAALFEAVDSTPYTFED